jgi:leader peptidase (prepilin peptidase)/N-methyltransferase
MLEAWPRQTWPLFLVVLSLLASLAAMTLVDAKTFTIPLSIPRAATLIGAGIHVTYAGYLQVTGKAIRGLAGQPAPWSIPLAQTWGVIGLALGAALGIVASLLLVRFGLIRQSFLDYDEWEAKARAQHEAQESKRTAAPAPPAPVAAIGRREAGTAGPPDLKVGEPHMWIQYPHARREMLKELIFLTPCIALAWLGFWLFDRIAGISGPPPLILKVFAGVILGYLVGGGIVWGVRILGSLAFGKEAMGLGDVHLMGAVGACAGWDVAVLGFFGAAPIGLAWAGISRLVSGSLARAMPYGPFLAVSTVVVLLLRPLIDRGLALLLNP